MQDTAQFYADSNNMVQQEAREPWSENLEQKYSAGQTTESVVVPFASKP